MSDASTIDKDPADSSELVKKNGSSAQESNANKDDNVGNSKVEPVDSGVNAIETMLMNNNKGPVKVYLTDGPSIKIGGSSSVDAQKQAAMNSATSSGDTVSKREREATIVHRTDSGMKGNLLQYNEPLVINSRFRTEHLEDRGDREFVVSNNKNYDGGVISLRKKENKIDYPPHYQLSYHPNMYHSKRSLPKQASNLNDLESTSLIKSNNEKRPSSIVYSNFPSSNLIEVPTKQRVYFNSDDQLLDKLITKQKNLRKQSTNLDNTYQVDTLIPSNYPRNTRYNNPSSYSSSTSDELKQLTNSQKIIKNNQQSNVISQLIRIQPSVVVKGTSNSGVTYDSS